jgi:uncharacterized protein YpmS
MQNRVGFLFIVSTLIIASVACNYPTGGKNADPNAIPVTTEAALSLQDDLNAAIEQFKKTGKVRLVIGEEELTSLLALELQKQENPVLENPQVFLRDGQMRVMGKVEQGGISADLEVMSEISVTDDGKPRYRIVDATLGSLPLPRSMMDNLSEQIDAAFQNNISPRLANVFIDSITITDGEMIIKGHSVM